MSYKMTRRLSPQEVIELVIYRDDLILVLNKPSGIAVHNAGGSNHNLEQYFHLLCFDLPNPPVLAHRLDLGTSGCLVLARHSQAARLMQELFTEQKIKKSYIANVYGSVAADEGHIDIPLAKLSPLKKHWHMKADPQGKFSAFTQYQVISRSANATQLLLIPHTGRTHQLRVHCQSLGHPIIGDYIYGDDKELEKQRLLHLHARSIEIPLDPNRAALKIKTPMPEHMMVG